MKLISFVIPTYNFAEFISETLNSILNEDSKYYEIIIYDGFSTDNTYDVIREYLKKYDFIKYLNSGSRNNIDVDLNNAILEASGEYIWTLSSDDCLEPGWLSKFININNLYKSDIYLFPAQHCDIKLNKLYKYPIANIGEQKNHLFTIENDEGFINYLNSTRSSEGLFSFCSSCVVKKERIQDSALLEEANGTCWRYATRLIQVSLTYPSKICLSNEFFLLKRGENDSFGKNGIMKRLVIAIVEWKNAVKTLNLSSFLEDAILQKVYSDIRFISLFYMKQMKISTEEDKLNFALVVNEKFRNQQVQKLILLKTPICLPIKLILELALIFKINKLYKKIKIYL